MWILVTTLCAVSAPGEATCLTEMSNYGTDKIECLKLRQPMVDYLMANNPGLRITYASAHCEFGKVA